MNHQTSSVYSLIILLTLTSPVHSEGRCKDSSCPAVDFDECLRGTFECTADSSCVNLAGSYTCQCNDGYEEHTDGKHKTCVGECLSPICHQSVTNLSPVCRCSLALQCHVESLVACIVNETVIQCHLQHNSSHQYCQSVIKCHV